MQSRLWEQRPHRPSVWLNIFGILGLSTCCLKEQTTPMLGLIMNIIIIVNTIIITINVCEAQYVAGVWLKVTRCGPAHHLQSSSTLSTPYPPFQLHLFCVSWAIWNCLIDGSTKQCQNVCKDDPCKVEKMHNDPVSLFFHISSFPVPYLFHPVLAPAAGRLLAWRHSVGYGVKKWGREPPCCIKLTAD